MTKKRSLEHLLGLSLLKRMDKEPILYAQQRPKIQRAIDGMVQCELCQVVGGRVMIKAGGVRL